MPQTQHTREILLALSKPPNPIFRELGQDGELLLAKLRFGAALIYFFMPLTNLLLGGHWQESLFGFIGVGITVILSFLWLHMARQPQRPWWFGYASVTAEASAVTGVMILLALREPSSALNSFVVFCFYFLVITAAPLRHDVRVTFLAGIVCSIQYALLSIFLLWRGTDLQSEEYGTANASTSIQRVLLLLSGTFIAVIGSYRAQRSAHLTTLDPLTGLPNRNFLNQRLPEMIELAKKQNSTLTLALLNLDHFGEINRELRHQTGDRALRHCVEKIQQQLKKDEYMMRIEGDEFVLLLWQPVAQAYERLDGIRKQLAASPFMPSADHEPRKITVSIGSACCPSEAGTVSELLKVADSRLQFAKQNGRNQVRVRD
jgi:two-component system, cell cycle response regulator